MYVCQTCYDHAVDTGADDTHELVIVGDPDCELCTDEL